MSTNKGDINTLVIKKETQGITSNNYNITVSDSYLVPSMYHNDEEFNSSMLKVYGFELTVNSINGNVTVDSAVFKQSSSNETWEALDNSYYSTKSGIDMVNIIKENLEVGKTYCAYFMVNEDPESEIDYKGTITFNFSDGTSVTIDTEFK